MSIVESGYRHSPDDWTSTKRSMMAVLLELATS
jgi:hypothetical protein